ncbi:MAG TPA: hypothetical protein VK601_17610, partial [Kofleriaceae bacterium]|nr:hypothetical protein [Kofleriaceae bacterium]
QGSSQSGSSGQGSNQQSGSNQPSPGQQAPRGRGQRGRAPQSPHTPTEGKLDDLDNYSRKLQREEARRHATGKAADPQHDW